MILKALIPLDFTEYFFSLIIYISDWLRAKGNPKAQKDKK